MSADARVRICRSDALTAGDRLALRMLLDAAFGGEFADEDWEHALGGTHAILEADGIVVAHAAVVPRDLEAGSLRIRTGYIEAVAVRPDRQRAGLGTAVMRALAPTIEGDFDLGALSTGEWGFYERLGWERWRGPTRVRRRDGRLEPTPDDDDSLMVLRTPRTPPLDLSAPLTCETRAGDVW